MRTFWESFVCRIRWLMTVTLRQFSMRYSFYWAQPPPYLLTLFHHVGLISLYIMPAGSPGSYSMSHTGDTYLGLHSLNGEGLSIGPSLQPQVCSEVNLQVDRVDLRGVSVASKHWRLLSCCLAPIYFSSDPVPAVLSIPPASDPHSTN